ncbi:MAG: BrnT family toxin [Candidatus Omnitrophota bacterium]
MKFAWDAKKARSNLKKHKVSFEEASTSLSDPFAATGADPDHGLNEFRYITFGVSEEGRLLVVAHTEEDEIIRIISARLASKGERKIYEEG